MSDETKKEPAMEPNGDVKALIVKARLQQELFKKSPKVVISAMGDDPMMEARRAYLKDSLGPNPTKAAYFALKGQLDAKAARGYEPVVNEAGHMVTIGDEAELVLMSRPMAMFKAEEAAAKQKNADKLSSMKKTFKKDGSKSAGDGDVPTPDRSRVTAEELEYKSGQQA